MDQNTAAILCSHVASGEMPILLAARTEPENEMDSGWQFLCNAVEDDWQEAKVWSLSEVLSMEPSLGQHIDSLVGTTLVRSRKSSNWRRT